MDPLSVAMSIVGLLKAADQISSTLQPVIKKTINAPKEIKEMKSSVDTIRTVLSQLQLMLLGRSQVSRHRTSLILVEQIVITLSACVTTFSDLDVFVETLGSDAKMGLLDRVRWATKTSTIQEHMNKLEVHKSTLTLMMTILTCKSVQTAEDAVDSLSTTIQRLLESNILIAQRLASIEVGLGVTSEVPPFAEFEILNQASGPIQRNSQGFAFEEELSHSWVYKRSAVRDDNGAFSIMSSAGRTASWSMLSGLSLADNISVIAVQALPIYEQDLSNSDLYAFRGNGQIIVSSSNLPMQHNDSQEVTTPPKKSLKSWWTTFSKLPRTDNTSSGELSKLPGMDITSPRDSPVVFGAALNQSIVYANVAISVADATGNTYIYGYIPIVVAKICVFAKDMGKDCVDIFAHSGSAARVHQLEIIFDNPDRYGKGLDWGGYSVHDAATCLLRYLKRLPEPVIPFTYYDRFTSMDLEANIDGDEAVMEMTEVITKFQQYITELPPLSRQLLIYLLDLCKVFSSRSEVNKMTSSRIIAAFQPSLLARHPSVGMSADDHRRAALTLVFMLENQDDFSIGMRGTAGYGAQTVKDEEPTALSERAQDTNSRLPLLKLKKKHGASELRKQSSVAERFGNVENTSKDEDMTNNLVLVDSSSANTVPRKGIARKPVPARIDILGPGSK